MFRYWVFNDPKWNWWTFDWADDVDAMHRRLAPIFDAVDPNLERFATSGGKMMMVMGWLDPVGSPIEAIHYYRSEEHTSELQSLMRISYAVFCLKKKIYIITQTIYY